MEGRGVNEIGMSEDVKTLMKVSREIFRPLESDNYRGDHSKARKKIGWEPRTKFGDLVKIIVESDLKNIDK